MFYRFGGGSGIEGSHRLSIKQTASKESLWSIDAGRRKSYQLKPKYDEDGFINMKKRTAAKIEELIKADAATIENGWKSFLPILTFIYGHFHFYVKEPVISVWKGSTISFPALWTLVL